MRSPEAVRDLLLARYRSQQRRWLREAGEIEGKWPMAVSLGDPTEEDARQNPEALATWLRAWQAWQGPGTLVWTERRWRSLGTHRLPGTLELRAPEEVAEWIGEESRWARARSRFAGLVSRWPSLSSGLSRHFEVLADYVAEDFHRLETMLAWLAAHPASGLYPRQLPVPGLDSKWLETRTSLVGDLLSLLRADETRGGDFYELSGLKRAPPLFRLMILDESLRARVSGVRDLSLSVEELDQLDLPASRIYVVENLQTGLAFGDLSGSVVFMRLGYGAGALARTRWIQRADCVYWGDLDTHGFRILSRVRTFLPRVRSLMMDEETLLAHRALWGEEAAQASDQELPALSADEQLLYRRLKQHYWGINVRLEQERIAWEYAWSALSRDAAASRV